MLGSLVNGNKDQFGLQLQFELDANFYSKENRTMYFTKFAEIVTQELMDLGYGDLSADEKKYLKQKTFNSGMQAGVKWGMASISSWDKPYRKCVADYGLGN